MKIMTTLSRVILVLGAWQAGAVSAWAEGAAGAPSNATNPLVFDPDLAWFTLVVFVLLLFVLTKFAWKPLLSGLERREQTIAHMIDEAKRNQAEAEQKLQAYERKLAEAAAEAQGIVSHARREATAAGEQLIGEARAAADKERQRTLAEIEAAKNAAVQAIADQSAQLAFTLARKLIHKELRPEDHSVLIRESLDQFPSEN